MVPNAAKEQTVTQSGGNSGAEMSETVHIIYRFIFDDGGEETVTLRLARADFALETPVEPAPDWTALNFHTCDGCPLAGTGAAACPFALGLSGFIERFDTRDSFDPVRIEVTTAQRVISSQRSLQQGMAALVGLVGATSGCPRLAFLRPMARFHLPFASEEETLFRVFSSFLLGAYLRSGGSGALSLDVDELRRHSAEVEQVNRAMANRLRAAFSKDAVVNAIVILDIFAQAVPYVVDDALKELRYLYGLGERGAGD